MSNALALVTGEIQATRDDFMSLLSDNSIKFEQEAGFALDILSKNTYALGVAASNRSSLISSVKNLASIGISLNPAKKQAYLVPRGGAICLDISYMGLIDLATATGSIKWAQADVVRENDVFTKGRLDQPPTHSFNPFGKDRGVIVGAYVVAKTADGDYLTTTMEIDEIYDIRNRSESWKSFVAKKAKSSPWDSDEGEMIKKTVIKRAYKTWPKTDRLEKAIHHLNTDGGEGLKDINDVPEQFNVEPLIAQALQTTTDKDALTFWKANNASLVAYPAAHKRLKEAIAGHRARMSEQAKETKEGTVIDQQMQEAPPASQPLSDEELDLQRTGGGNG